MIRVVLLAVVILLVVLGSMWLCDNTKYGTPLVFLIIFLFIAAVMGYALTGSIW